MPLVKTAFLFELKSLLRQPYQLGLLLFAAAASLYSLQVGYTVTEQRLTGIDSLLQSQQQHLQELKERFHADTGTATGKALASQAGIPQVVEFRNPPFAVHPPGRLATLSIGQSDLLPYFDIITTKRNDLTPPATEFIHAEKLLAGNFDPAFLLLYLCPLLIVAWNYNSFSQEKEQETAKLLAVQGGDIWQLIRCKWLVRFVVIYAGALCLSLCGMLLHRHATQLVFINALWWMYLLLVYQLFWFMVCWLVVRLEKPSRWNAVCLSTLWLFLLLLWPAIANSITDLAAPAPLKSEQAARQRALQETTWQMPIQPLLDSFYRNHPEYAHLRSPADTAMYGNRRFIAYYDLLNKRLDRMQQTLAGPAAYRTQLQQRMAGFNPAVQMQYLLNATAETGLADYQRYRQQADAFQRRWTLFLNGYLLHNRNLREQDLDHLPVFRFQPNQLQTTLVLYRSLCLWLATLLVATPPLLVRLLKKNRKYIQ